MNTCFLGQEPYRQLATYSHILSGGIMLAIGIYLLIKERQVLNIAFFVFIAYFVTWLLGDWTTWLSEDYHLVNAAWSVLDYVDIIGFLGAVYFYGVFVNEGKDIKDKYKIGLTLLTLYPLYLALTGQSILGFGHPYCESVENTYLTYYRFAVESLSIIAIIIMAWIHRSAVSKHNFHVAASLILFLSTFSITGLISSQTFVYEIQLYGMFVLPVFILLIMFAISRYDLFKLRLFNQQLLAWVLVPLVASELFFVSSKTDLVLKLITIIIAFALVYMLNQNIKRENLYLTQIENLNTNLNGFNMRQENLIHFISHEIKGYLAKNEAAFAGLLEGDYGAVTDDAKMLAETALADTRKGVVTVMDILNASNLKKGTTQFNMKPIDLKQVVQNVLNDQSNAASAKGLVINSSLPEGEVKVNADAKEIEGHVIRNLVDNAIKYTPKGSIQVSLESRNGNALLAIRDSGIGITDEDKKQLFTEGGRGKESVRTNVNSTGYGLFIAKQIMDAHKGRIWAQSEGQGKGSTFCVELKLIK